ncbi:DUF805 domain-containing protein [Erythrobacter sp. W302b]|uniref:DUF805 domain-containing protein n=1 Tax=Erythrobacter sp. W302b TaxID=3389874 RepID=UPI00396B3A00
MSEIGIYPAITASIGGKQRRLTLMRQWRRAIENGELDRPTPVYFESGPGSGLIIEAGACPELAPLFDEIKGSLPKQEPVIEQSAPHSNETQAVRLAHIEAEIAATRADQPARPGNALRIKPQLNSSERTIATAPNVDFAIERSGPGWAMLPLKRYAVFEGRARRSEYWNFQLFVILPLFFMLGVAGAVNSDVLVGIIFLIWLGLLIPSVAVTVRRLHDRGLSGWLVVLAGLLSLIPFVGFLIGLGFIVVLALPGTNGQNPYGPDPKS